MTVLTRLFRRFRPALPAVTSRLPTVLEAPREFSSKALHSYLADWLHSFHLPLVREGELYTAVCLHLTARFWIVSCGEGCWDVDKGTVTFDRDFQPLTHAYSDRRGRVHLGLSALTAEAFESVNIAAVARIVLTMEGRKK